jgi:hypothetical protein
MTKYSIIACTALASTLFACTHGSEPSWSESSGTTAEELGAVQGCTSQSQTCISAATTTAALAACEQELGTCLASLVAEAGVPLPSFDAGLPINFSFDAGSLPPFGGFDGSLPTLPDAGLPSFPVPEAGSYPGSACIQELQSCLSSQTSPTTCATQVETCLQQAI